MATIPISGAARLDGQVALLTGAAGGIGREVANTLAKAGATVIATDIVDGNPFAGRDGIHYLRYDVTSESETNAIIEKIQREQGTIKVLVLCAGSIANTPLAQSTDEEWASIWRVNVMGVVNPVRRIFPLMCKAGYGKIVALGSIAAKIGGVASGPAYVAAKSAVHGLMKWTAKSGAAHGVFANIVAPGPVETPMWQSVTERQPPSAHGSVPLGRFGQPEDIAQAILFLCSPQSNWITGTTLDVNGGMLMD
jgi:3-oxoacyl-[acyl-carrier protein] reductase